MLTAGTTHWGHFVMAVSLLPTCPGHLDRNTNNAEETVEDNIYHLELCLVELSPSELSCGELAATSYPVASCPRPYVVTLWHLTPLTGGFSNI